MKLIIASVVLGVFVSATTGVAQAGATPAQECSSTKIKATGNKAYGKLKCWCKEVVRPGGLAACNAKVDGKFTSKFTTAEAQGGCATTGDAGTIETTVDTFVDDVVDELTGSPTGAILGTLDAQRCARAKLRAAGKKSSAKLKCQATRAREGGSLDPRCISKAETIYTGKWDGAEARGGCVTTSDKDAIEARVDAFVDDVVGELPTMTTTTTTTTTLPSACPGSECGSCGSGCPEIHYPDAEFICVDTSVVPLCTTCYSDADCPSEQPICIADIHPPDYQTCCVAACP